MNLRAGPGSLHLLVQLDQQRQQVNVLSGDGAPLATVKTGKDAPQVLPGIYLKHGRGGLTLEQLRVSRTSGTAATGNAGQCARIRRTDGTALYGSPITYDVERREFRVVSGKDERVCSEDEVDQVILSPIPAEQPQTVQRPANRVAFADGTRLSGWIEGLADERLLLECREAVDADTLEAVSLPLAGIRGIVFRHKVSPPTRAAGKLLLLELDDGRLHGTLESIKDDQGKSRLAWKPLGSETSSAFLPMPRAGSIFRRPPCPSALEFDAKAKDRLYLRTGDVYRCRIVPHRRLGRFVRSRGHAASKAASRAGQGNRIRTAADGGFASERQTRAAAHVAEAAKGRSAHAYFVLRRRRLLARAIAGSQRRSTSLRSQRPPRASSGAV